LHLCTSKASTLSTLLTLCALPEPSASAFALLH
jgi:hypothetical protein